MTSVAAQEQQGAGSDLKAIAEASWRGTIDQFAVEVSGQRWKPARHLVWLVDQVQPHLARGNARVLIEAPPRHGKSLLMSVWTPAWFLEMWPDRRVILTSHADRYARRQGRRVRNILAASPLCRTELMRDSKAANTWNTSVGGGMITAGVGGSIMGEGADLAIVDDPHKSIADAMSQARLSELRDWYPSTLCSRLEPGASIVCVMHRWHDHDFSAILREETDDDWTILTLPEMAEADDPMGRKVGERLWPERFSEQDTARRKRSAKAFWLPMHQQRAVKMEGGNVKADWFREVWGDAPPRDEMWIFCSVDLAFRTRRKSDYTVCNTIGVPKSGDFRIWQLDCWREKLSTRDKKERLKAHFASWKPEIVGIESVGAQVAFVDDMREECPELAIVDMEPAGMGKGLRLKMVTPFLQNGTVWFDHRMREQRETDPEGADLIDELVAFPNARHDDMVDAFVYGVELARDYADENAAPVDATEPTDADYASIERELAELEKQLAAEMG